MRTSNRGMSAHGGKALFVLPLFVVGLIAIMEFTRLNTVASSGCPPLNSNVKGWPKNTTIYFDVSDLIGTQQTQARSAFQKWTDANTNNNTSGVRFVEKGPNTPAATFTVKRGHVAGSNAAQSDITTNANGIVTGAIVNIDVYDFAKTNPGQSGYDNIFLKIMLHEIGHTMGLDDIPIPNPNSSCGGYSSGKSVMNAACGVNDNGGNLPTKVKDCDNNTVKTNSIYAGSGGGSGGTGGGDTGGGGNPPQCNYQTVYTSVYDPAELGEGCYRKYHRVDYVCNGVVQWSSAETYDGIFCDPPLQ